MKNRGGGGGGEGRGRWQGEGTGGKAGVREERVEWGIAEIVSGNLSNTKKTSRIGEKTWNGGLQKRKSLGSRRGKNEEKKIDTP